MSYAIGAFGFIRWNGPPPGLVSEHLRTFTKLGQDGVGAQAIGAYGDPFDVELEAAFDTQANALTAEGGYRALVGTAPVIVSYNNISYYTQYSHKYLILAVHGSDSKCLVRMIGPSYNYASGWRLRSRWQLLPVVVA